MTNSPDSNRTACPVCKQPVEATDLTQDKNFPFCSHRCKMVDLGKWFDGQYRFTNDLNEENE